jgi:hypothetical protein
VGEGLFVSLPGGLSASSTVLQSTLTSLQGDFSILPSLTGTDLARMRVAGWEGYKKTVLHFVNYNVPLGAENGGQVQTLTDVAVKLKPAPGLTPTSVTLYSPESGSTSGDVPFEITADGSLTFTIPALKIYGAAVVSY